MRKRIISLLVILNLVFLIPFCVNAESNGLNGTFNMTVSPKKVMPNETVKVVMTSIRTTNKLSNVEFTIDYDNTNFTYINYLPAATISSSDASVTPLDGNKIKFTFAKNSGNAMQSGIIGTFTFKAADFIADTTSTFSYLVSTALDENGKEYNIVGGSGSKTIDLHVPSTNNYLSDLSIENATLSPSFRKDVTDYTISSNEMTFNISATKEDSTAELAGDGLQEITSDNNKIVVSVKSESGDTRKYVITVNKVANNTTKTDNNKQTETKTTTVKEEKTTETKTTTKSNDCTLKDLSVTNTSIKFDGSKEYSSKVGADVKEVSVKATSNDSKATIDGAREYKLNTGLNKIDITVTSESGNKCVYSLNITKSEEEKSSNNYLKSLSITDIDFKFDKNKTDYKIQVEKELKKLEFKYEVEDKKASAKLVGDTNNLIKGENKFTITVTSEDGKMRDYNIVIELGEEESTLEIESNVQVNTYVVEQRVYDKDKIKLILILTTSILALLDIGMIYTKVCRKF